MRISAEQLAAAAEATGFRADMLERVAQLLGLLDAMQRHPFLRGKLALKGGTALNLFVFDLPRLSVDIDLNYVGAESREAMLDERPRLEEALRAVFGREDLTGRLLTSEHTGGKWTLRYPTASGQTGRIDVDINYMYRVPLWPITAMDSHRVGPWRATGVPVVDVHELAAGKLAALLSRHRARDLFDSRLVFSIGGAAILVSGGYRLCGRSSSGQGLRTQGRGRPLRTRHLVPQAPGCGRQSGFARSALLRCSLAAVNRKGLHCDPFMVMFRRLTCKRRGLSRSTVGTGGGVRQVQARLSAADTDRVTAHGCAR